jgi:hypothetical protein
MIQHEVKNSISQRDMLHTGASRQVAGPVATLADMRRPAPGKTGGRGGRGGGARGNLHPTHGPLLDPPSIPGPSPRRPVCRAGTAGFEGVESVHPNSSFTTASHHPHGRFTAASPQRNSSFTAAPSRQLHSSLLAAQQPNTSLTAAPSNLTTAFTTASQQPHSSQTPASRQLHSTLTAASQQPHSPFQRLLSTQAQSKMPLSTHGEFVNVHSVHTPKHDKQHVAFAHDNLRWEHAQRQHSALYHNCAPSQCKHCTGITSCARITLKFIYKSMRQYHLDIARAAQYCACATLICVNNAWSWSDRHNWPHACSTQSQNRQCHNMSTCEVCRTIHCDAKLQQSTTTQPLAIYAPPQCTHLAIQ